MATKRVNHQKPVPRRPEKRVRSRSRSQPRKRSWADFRSQLMRSPKAALEGDLIVVVVGLVIVFFGSMFAAGGYYVSGTSSSGRTLAGWNSAAPAPTFGGIVYYLGVLIMVVGIVMALLSVLVYPWGRIRADKAQQPDGEPTSTRS